MGAICATYWEMMVDLQTLHLLLLRKAARRGLGQHSQIRTVVITMLRLGVLFKQRQERLRRAVQRVKQAADWVC